MLQVFDALTCCSCLDYVPHSGENSSLAHEHHLSNQLTTTACRLIGHLGYEPHLLHRLDMNTSGVLVFAKNTPTARAAHAQFEHKLAEKTYLAICCGVPRENRFEVDAPIGVHATVKNARSIVADGKPALTRFEVRTPALHHMPLADGSLIPLEQASRFHSSFILDLCFQKM